MRNIIWVVLLLSYISVIAQNPVNKTNDSLFVVSDTINGIPVYKKIADTTHVIKNIDIDQVENVELKDLKLAKRFDSLWYKVLYQPVLFDSIKDFSQQNDEVADLALDTVQLKKQLELLNQKTQLDIVYHPALARTIQAFLKNRKKSLGRLFKMSEYYFPIFEEKLAKYDIPLEMKYLAIVESALNPRAISRAGAGGLWQFMYSTGKMYGLEINSYVDERFDPIQSTEAACRHMQDLYKVFKDWNLVLAAYNSGAGNVTKAIRRSGGYKNYWNIRPYLPRETAGYVPLFQATLFLGEYAKEYGINTSVDTKFHYIATDTIRVKQTITFDQISKLLKINTEELEFLNPQYKLNIIPFVEDKNYTLKLPVDLVGVFVSNEKAIYEYVQKELNRREKPLPKFYKFNNYIVYKVRQGDYLGKIARKYHVSVSKIKKWNRLRSNRLRIGQKLRIYSRYAVAISSKQTKQKKSASRSKTKYIYYKVKPGDTLWNISRRYKISVTDIKKWNKLNNSDKLHPGMTLKIRKT
jgi:membrane-bound lytic murein transglycosylase D